MGKAVKNLLVMSIAWVALVLVGAWFLRLRLLEALGALFLGFGTIVSDFFSAVFARKNHA